MRILSIIAMLLAAAPALAQDSGNVTLSLTPAEVVALQRSLDRQPISQAPPAGFWPLQVKLIEALPPNSEARKAFTALWGAR